jgi:vacuolar-type H+-ATPase subunit I/STV1
MQAVGRTLVTVALIATIVGPVGADWNDSHVFNPAWPPHARFHAVAGLGLTAGFGLIGLCLLWKRSADRRTCDTVAALVPLLAWGLFFFAAAVPGAAVEDRPGQLPRVLGVPLNLFVAGLLCGLALAGYVLCRWGAPRRQPPGAGGSA